jgi:uncharacterized protein (DUF1778 family)
MESKPTMRTHTAEEKYRITLRVNRDLLEELRQAAKRESRTVNTFMVHRLMQELMPEQYGKPTDAQKKK